MINPTRKNIIVHCAAPALKPCQKTGPGVRQQFKLYWSACFLLHHDCPRSDLPAADDVTNFHLHKVATTELTVDRKVEQRSIPQAAMLIKEESDLPNMLGFQRSLRSDCAPRIPNLPRR